MPDASDKPPKTIRMRLKCGQCGHTARYRLSRIFVLPTVGEAKDQQECAEHISFGDYFRCKKCRSAWPWELTADAYLRLTALMVGHLAGIEDERLVLAEPRLFDGSTVRSLAQAEEYLLGILEREPENAFVWNRLGNIYSQAELTAKASQAFARSLEIDPKHLESHFSLGLILHDKGQYPQAAEHLHQVVTLAWKNRELPEEKLRELVGETLRLLLDMTERTHGEIPVFPPRPPKPAPTPKEPVVLYISEFDLGQEADWERLVDQIMGKLPGPVPARKAPPRGTSIGRNDPCPCGSGRKYKRCCGK